MTSRARRQPDCGSSERLGLDSEEIDLVVFLVRNHLMMSQVAQKGDLDDQTTVAEFAREVGSIDRLKALYLLTYADMRAVAPKSTTTGATCC